MISLNLVIGSDKVDAIFGGHVGIDLPAGLISVEEGPRMAASSQITYQCKRQTRSWCTAHQAIDGIVVASAIVMNLQNRSVS